MIKVCKTKDRTYFDFTISFSKPSTTSKKVNWTKFNYHVFKIVDNSMFILLIGLLLYPFSALYCNPTKKHIKIQYEKV